MKVKKATVNDESQLLALMKESHEQTPGTTPEEWQRTAGALQMLLRDPQAGEAYLTLDEAEQVVGYIIMCRGFSLDYGGYFTWVEETFMRQSDQSRFRDQRFSP